MSIARSRSHRIIKRGVVTLGTAPIAAVLFYALAGRVPDAIPRLIGTYAGIALGTGGTLVVVGVRLRILVARLEAQRLPVAQLIR